MLLRKFFSIDFYGVNKMKNPKHIIFFLFCFSNVYVFIRYLFLGTLLGDASAVVFRDNSMVFLLLFFIISAYIFFMYILFRILSKISVRPIISVKSNYIQYERFFGKLIFIIQLLFILYCVSTGAFSANATTREGTVLSAVWVVLSPDNLFFIYYSIFRQSKYFKYNLCLALVSNVIRGWSAIFIFILFMELCYRYRKKILNFSRLIKFGTIVLLTYPFLLTLKYTMRALAASGDSFTSAFNLSLSQIFSGDGLLGYFSAILYGVEQIIARIQLLSNITAIVSLESQIKFFINSGNVLSYWQEGIYGLIVSKLFHQDLVTTNLGEVLANVIDPTSILGSWNSNPTFLAWPVLEPLSIIPCFIFTITLCFLTVFLAKKISDAPLGMDLVWYMWLILIVPGWFASLVLFVHSLFVFLISLFLFKEVKKILLKSTSRKRFHESS